MELRRCPKLNDGKLHSPVKILTQNFVQQKGFKLGPSLSQQSTYFWGWLSVDFNRALLLRCLLKLKPGEEFSKGHPALLAEASALTFSPLSAHPGAEMGFCSLPAHHLCLSLSPHLLARGQLCHCASLGRRCLCQRNSVGRVPGMAFLPFPSISRSPPSRDNSSLLRAQQGQKSDL